MPLPLSTLLESCLQRRARHDSGPRTASQIKHIVIHSTEGGSAAGVATFFATTAQASTQLVIDDKECWRCVPDLVIPWGAPGVNTSGLHIEHCGYAKWTREEWLAHDRTLRRSAAKAARWAKRYKIPTRWVGPLGLKLGRKGFTRHMDASKAFTPGGHTDPGEGFPKDIYMGYVKTYLKQLGG